MKTDLKTKMIATRKALKKIGVNKSIADMIISSLDNMQKGKVSKAYSQKEIAKMCKAAKKLK